MEDGEVELSDQAPLTNSISFSRGFHGSSSVDTFFDDFLKNMQTCTHTHTCNPPGPDAAHTHTCYHAHTQVLTSEDDDGSKSTKREPGLKSRRSSGNREAVRKYREKKKAHSAYLEEEVKTLRVLNQQLVKKLQGQTMLEAEVLRLRSLLMDFRGKIDTELGVFPLQKQCSSIILKEGDCRVQANGVGIDLQCAAEVPCLHPHIGSSLQVGTVDGSMKMVNWEERCHESSDLECQKKQDGAAGQNMVNVIDTNFSSLMMSTSMDMDRPLMSSSTSQTE